MVFGIIRWDKGRYEIARRDTVGILKTIEVREGEFALYYKNGMFVESLKPGRHGIIEIMGTKEVVWVTTAPIKVKFEFSVLMVNNVGVNAEATAVVTVVSPEHFVRKLLTGEKFTTFDLENWLKECFEEVLTPYISDAGISFSVESQKQTEQSIKQARKDEYDAKNIKEKFRRNLYDFCSSYGIEISHIFLPKLSAPPHITQIMEQLFVTDYETEIMRRRALGLADYCRTLNLDPMKIRAIEAFETWAISRSGKRGSSLDDFIMNLTVSSKLGGRIVDEMLAPFVNDTNATEQMKQALQELFMDPDFVAELKKILHDSNA